MPLVNKQPFKPEPIPDNLGPDDEVFYFELTNEIFISLDAYFDRFLYCNSLVWTCSRTGKSGLTYKEALDSEQHLAGGSESPKKKKNKKNKRPSSPDNLKPESASGDEKKSRKKQKTDDGDLTASPKTNGDTSATESGQPLKKKKKKYPYDPKKYSMPVPEGFDPSLLTPTGKIDGRKLKSKQNQSLAEQLLASSGYQPKTPSPSKSGKGRLKQDEARRKEEEAKKKEEVAKRKQAELAKERELEAKRRKEAAALARQLERQKKEEERKKAVAFIQAWEKKCEDLERDDLRRLPQPTPISCEIPQNLFGDSVFIMEAIYNFHDLYSFSEIYPDGLKFDTLEEILLDKKEEGALGTLLMYLLRVIFYTQPTTDGYGLDDDSTMLGKNSSANISKDSNSRSDAETEIDGDYEHDAIVNCQNVDTVENEEEDNDAEKYLNIDDRISSAIKAAQEFKKTFSKPLPDMGITHSNVTEILRLHLLQSGSFPKGRTIYNGWYSSREDPGLWLCMEEPDLMKKLGEVTIYDLEIEERIKILHTLIYQLLTFIKSRLYMEMASDQLLELRKQYRKEAADFGKWDRENCVKRMQPIKRKTDQPLDSGTTGQDNVKPESSSNQPSECGDDGEEISFKSSFKANGVSEGQPKKTTYKNGEVNGTNRTENDLDEDQGDQSYEELERAYQQNKVDYEDYQRERAIRQQQVNEILLDIRTQLRNNQSVYAIHPIGRDRAYKRYWLFQSLPGLFVEQDDEYVGECLPNPTPLESRYKKLFGKENPLMHPNEADLIRPKTCDVACSTDSNDGHGPIVKEEPDETAEKKEATEEKEVEGIIKNKTGSDCTNNNVHNEDEDHVTDRDAASEHDGEPQQDNDEGVISDEMNYCTGEKTTCYIHGPKRPTQRWWFYHTPDSIDQLIECLNKRGYRESELHDALAAESVTIKPRVAECEAYKLNKRILELSGIRRSRRLRTKTGKRRARNYD